MLVLFLITDFSRNASLYPLRVLNIASYISLDTDTAMVNSAGVCFNFNLHI